MASTIEKTNREKTERIWELIERDDLDSLDEVLAEDVVLHVPGEAEVHGIDGYREIVRAFTRAFPDMTFELHDMFVDGDVVITHYTGRGTHEGALQGIDATGRTIESPGVTIDRFEDGKVVEERNFWDNLDFFVQLGVMEPPTG